MKSRYKRNILKEKVAWIEPVRPIEKIQINFKDIRTIKELPDSLTCYETKIFFWIIIIAAFSLVVVLDYYLISQFSQRTDLNLSLVRQTILTASGAIFLMVVFPLIKRIRKKVAKFRFGKTDFKYYDTTFKYEDIVGIYTFHEPRRYGMETFNTIILRTKDRVIHKLDPNVLNLHRRHLVNVLSAYLCNYRNQKN